MNNRQQQLYDDIVKIAKFNECKVLSLVYKSARAKMEFKCPNGHTRITSAEKFKRTPKSCNICAGHCQIEAKTNFIKSIERLGGTVIGEYKGTDIKVECICSNNHVCFPFPGNIRQDRGMCKKCAENCPIEAENNFISNIESLGGKIIGKYNGHNKVECVCINDHICFPRPADIQRGIGMCKKCAGNCLNEAKMNFFKSIENLGGTVVGKYTGAHNKVECICYNNHVCFPLPNHIQQGGGMCIKCANNCPIEAELNFIKSIELLGGKVIGKYTKCDNKVECICLNNHVCFPYPSNIQRGRGMCKTCFLNKTESRGEMITSKALDILKITYTKQYKHPNLPKLRFDFQFEYDDKCVLIEFDGLQHQKRVKYFHRNPGDFEKCRQRDLMKNYLVKNIPNCVLIRLDHTWVNIGEPGAEAHEVLAEYFNTCILTDNTKKIIADHYLYDWIEDEPSKESINNYFY